MSPTTIRKSDLRRDISVGVELAQMHGRRIGPEQVARALRLAGVKYVLVGAHAANGYTGQPRTTLDVDVLVQFPRKATTALSAAFPHLTARDTPVVTRFMDGDAAVIDVMKANTSKLWPQLLKHSTTVLIGEEQVNIPVVEGVLAAKFAAMVSHARRAGKKMIDGGDFIHIVEANDDLDAAFAARLAELVYVGGGAELLNLVGQARRGEQLRF